MGRDRKFTDTELYEATKEILLANGYSGFTFRKLAEKLNVSRTALYKYFTNKDELLTNYTVYEMDSFLANLQRIDQYKTFQEQFNYLFQIILMDSETHQIREIAFQIPTTSEKVKENKRKLEAQHKEMYTLLQDFVEKGKNTGHLKSTLPDSLILGFIFQTIDIPNHFGVPQLNWVESIREIICHGMFTEK